MSRDEAIKYLTNIDATEYGIVTETAARVRAFHSEMRAEAAPKKRGRPPGSKRKQKPNGAEAEGATA